MKLSDKITRELEDAWEQDAFGKVAMLYQIQVNVLETEGKLAETEQRLQNAVSSRDVSGAKKASGSKAEYEGRLVQLAEELELCIRPSESQRDLLMQLFQATRGNEWKKKDNWGSSRPLSTWHGVVCDASGNVTQLLLEDNNLRGLPLGLAHRNSSTLC